MAETLSSVVGLATTTPGLQASAVATAPGDQPASTIFGLLGRLILFAFRVIPSVLYWLITFTTMTLPAWLFTLFSTSLTFTMNFTTL